MKRTNSAAAVLVTAALAGGLLVAAVPPALGLSPSPGIITTVAGGAGRGLATHVAQEPESVAAGPGGAVYVGDDGVVREFTSTSSFEHVAAGIGPNGVSTGNGRLATTTAVGEVTGDALDAAGNLVIAGDSQVRVMAARSGPFYGHAMTAGHIYTLATIPNAYAVAIDSVGNVVISTFDSERVEVFAASTATFYGQAMTAGQLYTIAGNGAAGYNGDGIPAVSAELGNPRGLTVDAAGNVVLADTQNFRIRVIAASTGTFYGQAMTTGDIYTIAGNGVPGYSGDGGPAASAEFIFPTAVAVDTSGNVLITDSGRIRLVAPASGPFYGQAMTAGDIYTIAGTGRNNYSGDGGPATSADVNSPEGVALDAAGNVLIADTANHRVRVVAATSGIFYRRAMTAGDIYTVAGNGGEFFSGNGSPARDAELEDTGGVAVSGSGDLVISDLDHSRVRVVAGSSGTGYGLAMTAGDIYTIAGTGIAGYSGDGGPATAARLRNQGGLAVDGAGNVVIADTFNQRIRVVAAVSGPFYGQVMTAGDIYTIAGNGTLGYSGDGGPATSAEFTDPEGVTVDASGNVLVNDSENGVVRVVAAVSGTFYGQVMTAGDIYTIAGNGTLGYSGDGGPATSAELYSTGSHDALAVDQSGNVLIADSANDRVRVVAAVSGPFYGQVMSAGDIYTIAGTGTRGYSGDGGPAASASLYDPTAVTVDDAGNVIIADEDNNRVRVVAAVSGTFYGQAMTAGDIYTIAGNGASDYSGDGGPGTSAGVFVPIGVAVDSAGNVLIADSGNYRVREVFG